MCDGSDAGPGRRVPAWSDRPLVATWVGRLWPGPARNMVPCWLRSPVRLPGPRRGSGTRGPQIPQCRLAWPLHKDDTHKSRSATNCSSSASHVVVFRLASGTGIIETAILPGVPRRPQSSCSSVPTKLQALQMYVGPRGIPRAALGRGSRAFSCIPCGFPNVVLGSARLPHGIPEAAKHTWKLCGLRDMVRRIPDPHATPDRLRDPDPACNSRSRAGTRIVH